LFNTKKCREKKEQAGQLQQANTAVQNLQNTTIAQPQYVPAVMPSSYTPAVMPSSSTDAIEVKKSKEKEKDEKSFFEKYGILIVIGAVLLVAFLFFRKKKI
jgi:cobalamin biosynthesis Mg chelatase CobN